MVIPPVTRGGGHAAGKILRTAETDDSREQMAQIQRQMQDASREGEETISHLHDSYEKQSVDTSSRQENALNEQRMKGYEELGRLKRDQEVERHRIQASGEKELRDVKRYYLDNTYSEESGGRQKLTQTQRQNQLEIETEQKRAAAEIDWQRQGHEKNIAELKAEQEKSFETTQGKSEETIFENRARYGEATVKSKEETEARYEDELKHNRGLVDRLNAEASDKLKILRRDTVQKLSAYETRQRDPFYRMVDIDASLQETQDAYVLTAHVPEHERKNFAVAVKGNQIVMSGYRRNEEKSELGAGHVKGTASFQSFSESFPINWPVEQKQLIREYDGDKVIIRIPKKNSTNRQSIAQARPLSEKTSRAEKPDFPDSLDQMAEQNIKPDDEPEKSHKRSGLLG